MAQRRPTVRPNLIDRALAPFAPGLALARLENRARFEAAAGGYTGARHDRRQTSAWRTRAGTADEDLLPDLATLRQRSRDLDRNAPLARGAINTTTSSVVGPGLAMQARPDRDALGLEDEAAEAWERRVEYLWRCWAGASECDLTRTQTFAGLQATAFRGALAGGDTFAFLRFRERPGSAFGLRVEIVEAENVSNPHRSRDGSRLTQGEGAGRIVAGGIEFDDDGAPVAVWRQSRQPGLNTAALTWDRYPVWGEQSGLRQVVHLYDRLRPQQSRGEPYLAPVIEAFKQLDRYTEAEVMAAVVSAMFTVFVKSDAEGLGPLEPTAETGGTTADQDYKLGAGAMYALGPGESIETANPGRPNQAFDPFVMAVLRQVGVALELPFEVLTKHFQSSYSAARAALIEAWRFFSRRREWLAVTFCQPIYEAFLVEQVARGRIQAPGFFGDPLVRAAWCRADWLGPAMGQLDEEKAVRAAAGRVDLGVSTLQRETATLTGGDWEAVQRQRRREVRLTGDGAGERRSPDAVPAVAPPADPDGGEQQDEEAGL